MSKGIDYATGFALTPMATAKSTSIMLNESKNGVRKETFHFDAEYIFIVLHTSMIRKITKPMKPRKLNGNPKNKKRTYKGRKPQSAGNSSSLDPSLASNFSIFAIVLPIHLHRLHNSTRFSGSRCHTFALLHLTILYLNSFASDASI